MSLKDVDSGAFASLRLDLYASSAPIAAATGLLAPLNGSWYLVTNYHVLSGKHPDSHEVMNKRGIVPDRVLVAFPSLKSSAERLLWHPHVQLLLDEVGAPLWCEHPKLGSKFDVVALPLSMPKTVFGFGWDAKARPDLPRPALRIGSDVAIAGYPYGTTGPGLTPIWKTGSVATEPTMQIEGQDFFLVDASTRPSMSGSPVIARRIGPYVTQANELFMRNRGETPEADFILGVYAGRTDDDPDTIGRVWRWRGVETVLAEAQRRVQLSEVSARVDTLGHFVPPDELVLIDDLKTFQTPLAPYEDSSPTPRAASTVVRAALMDRRFAETHSGLTARARIEAALGKNDGKILLHKADAEALGAALESPLDWVINPEISEAVDAANQLLTLLKSRTT
jgi:hypothetical protein